MFRRDLIIAFLASLCIHGGLGYGEKIYNMLFQSKKPKVVQTSDATKVELWVPPELPDVPVEPDHSTEEPVEAESNIAPPSLMDVPGNVQVDSFTQQMAPPPPPNLGRPDGGTMSIPKGGFGTGGVRGTLANVFDLKDLDQIPRPRGMRADPQYPFEMKRAGIPGEVTLEFVVDQNGDVRDVVVRKSSHREFEAPAIQAVQKWKFTPGKKGGKNVNTRMMIPIAFNLNEDE